MRLVVWIGVLLSIGVSWYSLTDNPSHTSANPLLVQQSPMVDIMYERQHAHALLNHIRKAMGIQTLGHNTLLEKAAQNHADYLVKHHQSSHNEVASKENFTGVKPVDRVRYVGYKSMHVSENLSTNHTSADTSIRGLLAAIYHRFGLLDPLMDEIGIGIAQDPLQSSNSAFVYDMGNSHITDLCEQKSFSGAGRYLYRICADSQHRIDAKEYHRIDKRSLKNTPAILHYPYRDQQNVPPAFYSEIPDPLPDMEVSGFPISIMFNPYYLPKVTLTHFTLYEGTSNREIPARILDQQRDPHHRFTALQFALFPLERLDYNHHYRVALSYQVRGKEKKYQWAFDTQRITEDLYTITQAQQTLSLKADRSSVLYFKPQTPHDLLGMIHYPQSIALTFLDNHTVRITPLQKEITPFILTTDKRKIEISIAPQ